MPGQFFLTDRSLKSENRYIFTPITLYNATSSFTPRRCSRPGHNGTDCHFTSVSLCVVGRSPCAKKYWQQCL